MEILKHFGFDKYFVSMHGADYDNVLKKSDIVKMCIKEMCGNPDNTVLIGDTIHGALGAQEAGIPFIGITYGFGFENYKDVNQYNNIGYAGKTL